MAIKKSNVQVYVTLPKWLVDVIDDESKNSLRSRSKQIAYIIQQHYKAKESD